MIAIVDRNGRKLASSPRWQELTGITWTRGGREVWFSGTGGLHAVDMKGKVRDLIRLPEDANIHDVDENGDALIDFGRERVRLMVLGAGQGSERDLSVGDNSLIFSITPDGRYVLINEQKRVGGKEYSVFLRATDDSPAVRIGSGYAVALSIDAKWAITNSLDQLHYSLVPTGAGEPRLLGQDNMRRAAGSFLPDDKRIVFLGQEPGHGYRLYVQDLQGGSARPISPEGVRGLVAITPDGKYAAATIEAGSGRALYPVDGGAPKLIHGVLPGERIVGLASDHIGYVQDPPRQLPQRVYRVDLETGRRELLKTLAPADMAGVESLSRIRITPNGKCYAYNYDRRLFDLYIVKNLH